MTLAFSALSLGISQDYLRAGQKDASTNTYYIDIFLEYLECRQEGQSCEMCLYFPAQQQRPRARHGLYFPLYSLPKGLPHTPLLYDLF